MRFGHQVDAARHVLHGSIGGEAHIGRETLLRLLGTHARRKVDEHVCTAAHTLLHQQDVPTAFLLQLHGARKNLRRMALLVEVQHQPRERKEGVGYGAVVVLERSAMGRPYGKAAFQFLVAGFDEPAELGQGGLAACLLPLLAVDGHHGCAVPVAHAGKGAYS